MPETTDLGQNHPFVPPPINEHGRIDTASYLRYLMYAYAIAILLLQIVAMPGEVLLRRRFGARYLDPIMVIFGYFGILLLGIGGASTSDFSVVIFANVYFVVAIIHRLAIFHRDLKGETWHSQSAGLSWPMLTVPARLIGNIVSRLAPARFGADYRRRLKEMVTEYAQLFIEPSLVSLAGVAFVRNEIGLGVIFPMIAAGMLLRGVLEYHMERTRMLDIIDASIEAEHRIGVLTGSKSPEQAQGYKVSGIRLPPNARQMLTRTFAGNDEPKTVHGSA